MRANHRHLIRLQKSMAKLSAVFAFCKPQAQRG